MKPFKNNLAALCVLWAHAHVKLHAYPMSNEQLNPSNRFWRSTERKQNFQRIFLINLYIGTLPLVYASTLIVKLLWHMRWRGCMQIAMITQCWNRVRSALSPPARTRFQGASQLFLAAHQLFWWCNTITISISLFNYYPNSIIWCNIFIANENHESNLKFDPRAARLLRDGTESRPAFAIASVTLLPAKLIK